MIIQDSLLWKVLRTGVRLFEEGVVIMANSFNEMTAAVDRVADSVRAVADAIANPAVDNNDQAVIDDLTSRLNSAADALDAATSAENAEDAGSAGLGRVGTTGTTTSTDVGGSTNDTSTPNPALVEESTSPMGGDVA
jgi:hypothetical protein